MQQLAAKLTAEIKPGLHAHDEGLKSSQGPVHVLARPT